MSSSFVYADLSSIWFDPDLPSSVCGNERINITVEGWFTLSSEAKQFCEAIGGSVNYAIFVELWENDIGNPNDLIANKSIWGYDTMFCDKAYYEVTFYNVKLSDHAGGLEGNTIEVYATAIDYSGVLLGSPKSTSSYDVDVLYNCDCLSGSCCDLSSRPYEYKPSGSQPTGYTDEYTCSGDNTPVGTNWVYRIDYYCDGVSSSAKSNNVLVDTCGPCEYCTPGDSTCNYYDSSTICGIKDCNSLDTDCRDYHDKDRYCNGAGTCLSPSCDSYTNEPKHTSCGTGRECDGDGNCVTCKDTDYNYCHNLGSDLQSYFWDPSVRDRCEVFVGCDNNDVYWYDACENMNEKQKECGEDSCDASWHYYCNGKEVWRRKFCLYKGCSNTEGYSNCYIDTEVVQDEYVETCSYDCSDGECIPGPCSCTSWQNVGCGQGGCPSNQMYQTRTCTPSGCSSQSRCVDDSSCQPQCQGTDTSCGIYPTCQNCNSNDGCNGDYYRNYYCVSNPSGCSYTSDNCNDCSCSCGDYNKPEVDTYCIDGKDNDCDGLTDENDPGCGGVELNIDWEYTYGSNDEQGNGVVKTYGGYIAAGYTQSTNKDSYLAHATSSGLKGWYFNRGYTEANAIVPHGTYASLIVGSTVDHYAIEEYYGTKFLGGSNIYLALSDYNGAITQVGVYGDHTSVNMDTDEYAYDVVATSSLGSYIVAGSSSATGNLFKTYAWVVWVSENGNKEWDKGFLIRDGDNSANSIAINGYDLYVTGFASSYQIDMKYVYIMKVNYLGTKQWSYEYGQGAGNAIEVTPDNELIVAGEKDGMSYILKTDISGNKKWDATLDTGEATSVKVDSSGNYIVLANKNNDIQIFKVSSAGDVIWKKTFDTTNTDLGKDLIIDGEQYVVTGKRNNDLYLMKTKVPCIADCTSGKTRCNGNYKQTCGNYDSDSCLEWPPSTSGSGNDDCSDCSCSCGGYGIEESMANLNCDDGKDNDCDGQTDYGPLCRLYFNISLNKGWNLISFPLNLKNNSIQAIFKNINFSSIFSYDSWIYYFNTTRNNFNTIDESKGYWVNSLRNQTLKIEGLPFASLEILLKQGWNLVGYPSLNVSLINKTINISNIDYIFMYNNSKWYSYDSNRPSQLNTLTKFTPGYGYWIKK